MLLGHSTWAIVMSAPRKILSEKNGTATMKGNSPTGIEEEAKIQ